MVDKLSNYSKEEAQELVKVLKESFKHGAGFDYPEPYKEFDEYGLRFSQEFLSFIGVMVVTLPLEMMADFADIVTVESIDANDQEFIFNQILDKEPEFEAVFAEANTTSIGNLAYIVLNCKNQKAVEIATTMLNEIHVHVKGLLLAALNEII